MNVWWPLPLVRVQALIKITFRRNLHLWRELIRWGDSIYSLWLIVLFFGLNRNCWFSLLLSCSVCGSSWLLSPLRSPRRPASFIWSISFLLWSLSTPKSRLPNLSKVPIKILFLIPRVSTSNSVYDNRLFIVLHFLLCLQRADIFEIDHILIILLDPNFEGQISKFILYFVQLVLFINLFEVPQDVLIVRKVIVATPDLSFLFVLHVSQNLLLLFKVESYSVMLKEAQEFGLLYRIIWFWVRRQVQRSLSCDATLLRESLLHWVDRLSEFSEIDFEIFILVQSSKDSVDVTLIDVLIVLVHEFLNSIEIEVSVVCRV